MNFKDNNDEIIKRLEAENIIVTPELLEKLEEYNPIWTINEIENGQFIRWISPKTNKLMIGGHVMDVKTTNTGLVILCKGRGKQFFNIRFDDCCIFVKNSNTNTNTDTNLLLSVFTNLLDK